MPRALRKLLTGLACVLLLAVLAELTARATEPGPFTLWDRSPYAEDPILKVRHKADWRSHWDGTDYELDSHGLRRSGRMSDEANARRILAVGDSCTFGKGVTDAATWPRQLEHTLRARGPAVVANAGVNGYSGRQYAEVVRRELDRQAYDTVIVGWNSNDFDSVVRRVNVAAFEKHGLRTALSDGTRDALGRLALYRWARSWWWHLRREKDWEVARTLANTHPEQAAEDDAAFEKELAHLDAVHALCQARGVRLVMFLFPYESQVLGGLDQRELQTRLEAACAARGIACLDLAAAFRAHALAQTPPAELFLRGDRYHPNRDGYALVAAGLVRLVESP